MSTRIWNKSFIIADDTALRAWGAGFKAELLALGLAYFGGIDWTTVVRAASTSLQLRGALIGSEVYGFADAKQGANPVFIQFSYFSSGYDSGNNNRIRLEIEVGFAQDGAGHLTGKKTIARSMEVCPYQPVTNYNGVTDDTVIASVENRLSGNSSRLTIIWGSNPPSVPEYAPYGWGAENMEDGNGYGWGYGQETGNYLSGALTIERSRDNAGAETTDGVIFAHTGFYKYQNNNYYNQNGGTNNRARAVQMLSYANVIAPPIYSFNNSFPYNRASGLSGSKIIVYSFKPISDGIEQNPPIGLLGCQDFDFEPGVNPGVEVYGTARNYYKTNCYVRPLVGRNYVSSRLLMLWE